MKQYFLILIFLLSKVFVFAQAFSFYPVGSGLSNMPTAMYVYKNELYVSGSPNAGGINVNNLGKWDGTQWKKVGGGLYLYGTSGCFTKHNDLLFFGGSFHAVLDSNNQQIENTGYLVAWDGTNWVPVLTQQISNPTTFVEAIASFNGDLYIGGGLYTIDNTQVHYIARWDGQQWYDVGVSVISYYGVPSISSMAVFNNELYVGGCFNKINGVEAFNIARWDGSQWYPVGTGTNDCVHRLFNDSLANRLIVGGQFNVAGTASANDGIAFWDGIIWTASDSNHVCGIRAAKRYNNFLFIGGGSGCVPSSPSFVYYNSNNYIPINEIQNDIFSMEVYNGELYIGGYIQGVNSVLMNYITRLHVITTVIDEESNKKKLLENNIPNPFSQTTTIPYKLPPGIKEVHLSINNVFGKHLRIVKLDLQKTQIEINMRDLVSGVYSYTLVLDGKNIETKKMVLVK